MRITKPAVSIIMILVCLIAVGCGSKGTNSFTTATETLIPSSTPLPSATPLPTPLPTPQLPTVAIPMAILPDGSSTLVDSVCLSVDVSGDFSSLKVDNSVRSTLQNAGIKVVEPGGTCMADLSIRLTLKALGAQYANTTESCFVYSGAAMTGQASFTIPGHDPLVIPISDQHSIPDTISSCDIASPVFYIWTYETLNTLNQIRGMPIMAYALLDENLRSNAKTQLDSLFSKTSVSGQQGMDQTLPIFIGILRGTNKEARVASASVIGSYASTSSMAIPDLIQLLADPDEDIQNAAIQALGEFHEAAAPAVPDLLRFLESDSILTQQYAAEAIGNIGPSAVAAVPVLIEKISENNIPGSYDYNIFVTALGKIGPAASEAAPEIRSVLSPDFYSGLMEEQLSESQLTAARALLNMEINLTPDELASLFEVTQSTNSEYQMQVVELFGQIAKTDANALPYLMQVIDGTQPIDYWAQKTAILALAESGGNNPEVITILQSFAADESRNGELRANAYLALVQTGTLSVADGYANVLDLMNKPENSYEKEGIMLVIGELGPEVAEDAVPLLIGYLNDEDARWAAIAALGDMGEKAVDAVPYLIPIVPNTLSVGVNAVYALGQIGPGAISAVPAIINKLSTENNANAKRQEVKALQLITGQDFGSNVAQWQEWWSSR
mgnify:FL=1